ncbi:MAG TPA: fenitrothion hydrolase, partial [Solirubrobacteraceae bacterium]|nr:fenitrothion hydrolase [Solirubrobacteraceae bacterium]
AVPLAPAAVAATLAAALAAPAPASAHGLSGRGDLPVPDWLFTWGATAVLVVSFVALATLWPKPRLQEEGHRPLPRGLSAALTATPLQLLTGAIGVALLVLTVYAGFEGAQVVAVNFTPTFVYVVFWLALVPVQLIFGDVFRAFNPWRAIGRATGWIAGRVFKQQPAPLTYPDRLGYWPAALGLFAFGCMELVAEDGSDPSNLAVATLVYTAATLVGMALYGTEAWLERGEAFNVYFGLLARMSPVGTRDGRLGLRTLLSGLPHWPAYPGAVALLAVMIGVVTFDGLSAGSVYPDLVGDDPGVLAKGISMLVVVGIVGAFYLGGVKGAQQVDRSRSTSELARGFVHTLVPIAVAYVAAHYVSLLLFQGQAVGFIVSDPLGRGEDLLGTGDWTINYDFISSATIWYLQVAFVVAGHVAGLILAHDRALVSFSSARKAVRSQYWLLGVMVGFTTLALWLLSQTGG